jgi:hypothetical protein
VTLKLTFALRPKKCASEFWGTLWIHRLSVDGLFKSL